MFSRHHKSKMVLAVDGGRGPPEGKKRDLVFQQLTGFGSWGATKMKFTTPAGQFKNPPIHVHDGRGPPGGEKRDFFTIARVLVV